MTLSKLTKMQHRIDGDLSAQVLGVTDQHIHYFDNKTRLRMPPASNTKALGIHKLMFSDYQALVSKANESAIEINIASGFRSFERQLLIWNNKFIGKTPIKNSNGETVNITQLSDIAIIEAILLFSALPGASRHHWGCDIDIYAPNLLGSKKLQLEPWEYDATGPMAILSSWLVDNAGEYGFYFPYDSFRGGVAAEPWHLSYAPLAKQYQDVFNIESLKTLLSNTNIAGKETILSHLPNIFTRYINNINTFN